MVLSEKEAEEVVESLIPMIRDEIKKSEFGNVDVHIVDIGNISSAVKREGNTSDTYCKIARAMFNRGIATDLKTGEHELLYRFREVTPEDEQPLPEVCIPIWKEMWRSISSKNE